METKKDNLVLINDYHTHSVFSHGVGTVLDNAIVAKEKGLNELGICEHGPRHASGLKNADDFKKLKQACIEAENQTGVKVLCGIESNVLDKNGNCDFKDKIESLDYVAVGMHCKVKTKPSFFWYLFFRRKIFPNTKKQIKKNTQVILNVIEKNKKYVDIFTHPTRQFKTDIVKVAKAMKEADILFELNTRSCNITEDEIKKIAETGVKFIIGSDAHRPSRVGELTEKVEPLLKHIDKSQIVTKIEPKLLKLKNMEN